MDLIRMGVWAVVFVALSASWHDYGFLWFIPMWLVVTLGTHLYWHYRPSKRTGPAPLTRYTNPRYTKPCPQQDPLACATAGRPSGLVGVSLLRALTASGRGSRSECSAQR